MIKMKKVALDEEKELKKLNKEIVKLSYSTDDINDIRIKKGDRIKFRDLNWCGFGCVEYPYREGVVVEKEIDGMKLLCVDYSLENYERIAYFTKQDAYRKWEVLK